MAIAGAVMLMVRYKAINVQAADDWEEEYHISTKPDQPALEAVTEEEMVEEVEEVKPAKKSRTTTKKSVSKVQVEPKEKAPKKTPRARKSSS